MSIEAMKQDFEKWWHNEGSQSPFTHHDAEEHCKRMCEIAWSNGAYKAIAEAEKQVTYTSNGTAGRETDVRPTGFFFQMPKGGT